MPDHPSGRLRPVAVCIVGAGPGGTSVLERLLANVPELLGDRPLHVHIVDPYPPGAGRVWRRAQSPLLWANSLACDITLFTDEVSTIEGPIRPGPSLAEWAADRTEELREGRGADELEPFAEELAACGPTSFPSRPLLSAYLAWFFRSTVEEAPPNVRVIVHQATVVDVTEGPRRQLVHLAGRRPPLRVDAVILAQGHLDSEPTPHERKQIGFARRHGLAYLPTGYTADLDLDALRPGEPVLVRGIGLAFVDLMVRLSHGRGGTFERDSTGVLRYRASGREPLLLAASRRGVPYRSKTGYPWTGERPPLPRHFTVEAAREADDPWPLIGKELAGAHYHRLFTAHGERTTMEWAEFDAEFTAAADPSELIARAVPDPADRFDQARLDRPVQGRRFADEGALQEWMHAHIEADLTRRHDPAYSQDLATIHALLSVYGVVLRLQDAGDPVPDTTRLLGFFSYLASGPPGPRLEELLALARAGVIRFLGEDVEIAADEQAGDWRAASPSLPRARVRARALVEARLPEPSLKRTRDVLLRRLAARGDASTDSAGRLCTRADDRRVVNARGDAHPGRFAVGHGVSGGAGSAGFSRPRFDAPAFRVNDALVRGVLNHLRDVDPAADRTPDRLELVTGATR
ncbi:FAD/NAD(P)-binding protein [Embleya sp. NBC_00888]|uniref:FAD/NAD(P)-binding protein n=1 Tax=Embleya sp. NBC_00888 TaxID=2975960 RepID=UPI003863EE1B|nr:FAD/NAD(P)-binding protein [Embleya sp. NBC_00888]